MTKLSDPALDTDAFNDAFGRFKDVVIRKHIDPDRLAMIQRSRDVLLAPEWPAAPSNMLNQLSKKSLAEAAAAVPNEPQTEWDTILHNCIRRVPLDLRRAWPHLPPLVGADVVTANAQVKFAYTNGRIINQRVVDGHLLLVDRDLFAALVVYLVLIWKHGKCGALLASWIGLHIIIQPRERFPELDLIVRDVFTANPDAFATIARRLAQMIVGHELGHSYPNVKDAPFVDAIIDTDLPADHRGKISEWGTGSDYGLKSFVYHAPDGVRRLIIPKALSHWAEEHACDTFALWVATAAEASVWGQKPGWTSFESMIMTLVFWQPIAFLFSRRDWVQVSYDESRQEIAPGIVVTDPYPSWASRADQQIFHLDRLGDHFQKDWRSPQIGTLQEMHGLVWGKLHDEAKSAIKLAIQLIDPTSSNSNPDRIRSFAKNAPPGRTLSLYESLWWECLGPLAEQSQRVDTESWEPDLMDYTLTWAKTFSGFDKFFLALQGIGEVLNDRYE